MSTPQPSSRKRPVKPREQGPAGIERALGHGRLDVRRQVARLPPRLGAGERQVGERLGIGLGGELEVDLERLEVAHHLGHLPGVAGGAEGGALVLDAVGDGGDPPVRLLHPLVGGIGVGEQHVALDQRLGELLLQGGEEPHLPLDVGLGIDHLVLAAEARELLAQVAQVRLGLVEVDLGEADRVGARLLGQVVHERGRLLQDRPGDRLRVLRGEGGGAHLDDAGMVLVAHAHHPPPVRQQILDRGALAEREDPVLGLAVVDGAQVDLAVDRRDDLLAADVLEEDVGLRGAAAAADAGDGAEDPRRRRPGLLRADREGDVGMVLVLGAEVE